MTKKSIETLVTDIYHLLDEDTHHEPSEENLKWMGESVIALLRTRLSARERKERKLYFSSMGKPDRQLWYAKHHPDKAERMQPKQYMKFMYGDLIELLLLFLAKEAGHEVTSLQERMEVDGVSGKCDAVIDGVVVDSKSASSYSYQKFRDGRFLTDDPFGYLAQIGAYREALDKDRAGFLVADKVHGDIAWCEVPSEVLTANAPQPRIEHLKSVLHSETPPDRCYDDVPEGKSGNRRLATGCSYCAFKAHCWQDANEGQGLRTFYYSSGPKYFTHIEKTPKVSEDIEPF